MSRKKIHDHVKPHRNLTNSLQVTCNFFVSNNYKSSPQRRWSKSNVTKIYNHFDFLICIALEELLLTYLLTYLLSTSSCASALQVLCTPKRARMIVVVVCVAAACATLPEFFECRVQPQTSSSTNTTQLSCVPTWFGRSSGYSLGYKYANQALFTFIPLVLLAVFNALLIHAVLTAARRRQVMAKTGSQCITNRAASVAAAATTATGDSHERHRSGQQRITVLLLLLRPPDVCPRPLSFDAVLILPDLRSARTRSGRPQVRP